jgi:hypothetical protein
MKKFKARVLIAVALFFGAILAFLCIEHFRGEFALNSRLKQLAANGEKLEYKELLPPRPAPEQNAALDLFALTNDLKPFFDLAKSAPPMTILIAPGRAVAPWWQNSWEGDKNTNDSWDKFGPEIEKAGPALTRLENIWPKTGYDDGFDYAKGFLDSNPRSLLIFSKQTSVLLSEAVGNDLRRGDLETARKHLRSLLAVIKALGKEHLIIFQLVDEACASFAWNSTWCALQAPGWTDAQLVEIQTAWETANDFPSSMAKSCELEQALTLDDFRQIRGSQSKAMGQLAVWNSLPDIFKGDAGGPPTRGFWLRFVHLPVWRIAWAAQDELRGLDLWKTVVEGAKVADAKSWFETCDLFAAGDLDPSVFGLGISISHKEIGLYDRSRFLFSSQPFSVNGSTILRPQEVETQKNLVITAIALKRHELRHGKPAAALVDLVPEFLAAVPLDRMDGKSLRYHLNADGTFKLYSVGLNCTDDGGDPQPEKPLEKFGNIWQGKDAVWPVAVAH